MSYKNYNATFVIIINRRNQIDQKTIIFYDTSFSISTIKSTVTLIHRDIERFHHDNAIFNFHKQITNN